MKLNNKGFALTSIIYMLIVLFLMILLLILANLATRKVVLDKIKNDVKENLNQGGILAQNTYTVTFDPTIGQINQTTKQVTYNEPYGELPTPTREGYKFMGWKKSINLFSKDSTPTQAGSYIRGDGVIVSQNEFSIYQIAIKPNTTYAILNSGKSSSPGYVIYDENDNLLVGENYNATDTLTFTTPESASYIKFSVVTLSTSNRYDKEIFKLEENYQGNYDDSFIENTSIVIETKNHNLYAVWAPKYLITFDAGAGELENTTKEVVYGETYGDLPIPTREGYTFMGWNGKNIIDKSESLKEGIQNETPFEAWASPPAFNNTWVVNNLEPNKQYTISYDIEGISLPEYDELYSSNLGLYLYSFSSDESLYPNVSLLANHYIAQGEKYRVSVTFTAPSNVNSASAKYVLLSYTNRYKKEDVGVYSTVRLYNLQLEEGSIRTTFEPYYITPSTTVVQDKNHTLKAIWQANS